MSVTHRNAIDLGHRDTEIGTIAQKNAPFRSGVEQQYMAHAAGFRDQPQAVAEIAAQQHLAGDRLRPGSSEALTSVIGNQQSERFRISGSA